MAAATAFKSGDRVVLVTPFVFKDAVKSIPGRRWHKEERVWSIPASPAACAAFREAILKQDPTAKLNVDEAVLSMLSTSERAAAAAHLKDADELPPIPGVPPSELNPEGGGWLHQRQAYWFGTELEALMLAMWMGTGKSLVATRLIESWEANLIVVLCPVRVMRVWHRELRKWSERGWLVASGGGLNKRGQERKNPTIAQRVEYADEMIGRGQDLGKPVAIVANYEAAWQGKYKDWLPALKPDVSIFDESHKIKAPGGKWSRFAQKLGGVSERRMALTGTPMPSGPTALYGQFRALDPGIFGTNFAHYKKRYFELGGFEDKEVQGWLDEDAAQAHADAMASIAYICDKSVLDLPPEMDLPREDFSFDLGPEARKHYDTLESEFVTYVDQLVSCDRCGGSGKDPEPDADGKEQDCRICKGAGAREASGAVATPNALSLMIRLSQITSGFLPVEREGDDGEIYTDFVELDDGKANVLREALDDINVGEEEPVVIFCRFRHDLAVVEQIAAERGVRYAEISGKRDDALTPDAEMRPDVDLVAVQLQAGGVGIDLTRARYAGFYSQDFNLGDYQQSRDRVHRPGQTRETFYFFPTARGTIDVVIQQALAARENVVRACIRAAKTGSLSADPEEALAA